MTAPTSQTFRDEMQGLAALHTTLAKMDGYQIDKKAARYTAMADYMMHAGCCASAFSEDAARASLNEAVRTAVVGDPVNIPGQPFCRSDWEWMETSTEDAGK